MFRSTEAKPVELPCKATEVRMSEIFRQDFNKPGSTQYCNLMSFFLKFYNPFIFLALYQISFTSRMIFRVLRNWALFLLS